MSNNMKLPFCMACLLMALMIAPQLESIFFAFMAAYVAIKEVTGEDNG